MNRRAFLRRMMAGALCAGMVADELLGRAWRVDDADYVTVVTQEGPDGWRRTWYDGVLVSEYQDSSAVIAWSALA